MRRWGADIARTLALGALCVGIGCLGMGDPVGSSASAQMMSGMGNADGQSQAQAFSTAQQPATAAVVPNADVTQVPNSGGDTSVLQSYGSNSSALTSAGQNAASTSDSLNTAMLATANANHNVVKNTDSWLQQSLNIIQNPTSIIQPDSGAQGQTCTTTQTQQTVTDDNGTYTCETSHQVTDSQQSCTQTLVVDTSSTYTYACTNTYDVNARTWDISTACAALGASTSCTPTGSSCSQTDPGQFRATQCTKGTEWSSTSQTCQNGTGWTTTNPTCDPVRLITVATNYVYDGNRNWNGSTWAPDSAESALQGAGSTCQIQATNCTNNQAPSTYTCKSGYEESASASVEHCIEPYSADIGSGPQNFGNYCFTDANPYNQLPYTGAEGNPDCHLDSSAQETDVNGVVYTEDNFSCHIRQADAGCSPPQGATESQNQCTAQDYAGNCIEYTQTWNTAGRCETWTDQWLCTASVPGAGTPISTQQYVASDTWSNACSALSTQSGCSKTGETVLQGPDTRDIDGLSVYRDSWELQDTYTCNSGSGVNTCTNVSGCTLSGQTCAQNDPNTGQCSLYNDTYTCWSSQPIDGCTGNENGCTQTGSTCAGTDQNGNCSVYTYNYSCPVDDGSGGCLAQTNTYSCSADVPPADPASSVVTVETGTHWDQTCQQSNDPTCQSQGTTCNDANSTKTINGIQVTASCWSQTTNYECEAKGAVQTDCNPPAGCTWDHDQCLDDPPPSDGSCTSMDHVYKCQEQTNKTVTQSSCTTQMCFSGQCFTISGANDSNDLGKAFSALSIGQMGGADYANAVNNLKIMSGNAMRCRKAVLGFSNCCKDSGWGESLGLASCDDQEKQLIKQQETKACHYVGTYCSNKSFFGVCLQKSMRYCCFEGSLARIVNEAGRPQVNKGWGSAKNADCSGFTIDQFQQLDLSKVDFSDFYSKALSGLTQPSASSATSSIQSTLNTLYSGGTPVNPMAMPTLPTGP